MSTEQPIKVGDKFVDEHGRFQVMAIADGWAMVRRPRAVPFVLMLTDRQFEWPYIAGDFDLGSPE